MNVENVEKLIEATKAYEGFGYQSCGTCFLAVMRGMKVPHHALSSSDEFGRWLGLLYNAYHELFYGTDYANNPDQKGGDEAWDAIDKAHALRTLEHLKATGTVDWATTRES